MSEPLDAEILSYLSLHHLRESRTIVLSAMDAAMRWHLCKPDSLAEGIYVLEPVKEALRHLQAVVDDIEAAHAPIWARLAKSEPKASP